MSVEPKTQAELDRDAVVRMLRDVSKAAHFTPGHGLTLVEHVTNLYLASQAAIVLSRG